MNAACGNLDLAFLGEYVGDVPVGPATTAELLDEFTVWLQSRAQRFVGQRVQNGAGFGVHGLSSTCFHFTSRVLNSDLTYA
jgi:hypothetical protein